MGCTQGHTASERPGAAVLPTRHKVGFLTPGELTSHPTLPWARGALSVVPMRGSRQRGPADPGLPVWALSAVLIRPPRPCSPSGRRVPQVSLPAPSQSQLLGFRRPSGVRRPGSWGSPGSPAPLPTARRQPPFPRATPAPPMAPPRQSQVPPLPLISPAPSAPPYCSFASSGHVAGCLRLEAARDPPSAPQSPGSPDPSAPQPRSS